VREARYAHKFSPGLVGTNVNRFSSFCASFLKIEGLRSKWKASVTTLSAAASIASLFVVCENPPDDR